jgi:hypothetical protein
MAETFTAILTTLGLAEVAAAIVSGTPVVLDNFSVGDSNGSYYEPSEGQTALVNQQYIAALSSVSQDVDNATWAVAEGTIPADSVGGWYVREAGIWSDSGNLFAVAKMPVTWKPLLSSGAGKDLYIKVIMEVTNISSVTLSVDPNVAVATVAAVNAALEANFVEGAVVEAGVADGDVVYWNAGLSKLSKAKADGTALEEAIGFYQLANTRLYTSGVLSGFTSLVDGSVYYLSTTTAGGISTTVSAVRVGVAKGTTEIYIDIDRRATSSIGNTFLLCGA